MTDFPTNVHRVGEDRADGGAKVGAEKAWHQRVGRWHASLASKHSRAVRPADLIMPAQAGR